MSAFDSAIAFTLPAEGGLNNVPGDHGGITKYGISQAAHPSVDIANLTRDGAIDIYQNEYWVPAGCNYCELKLAVSVFDWAVQHSVHGAVTSLQKIIGATPDGDFGPKTVEALRNFAGPVVYLYNLGRRDWYEKDVMENPDQGKFLNGWINRMNNLDAYLKTL